VHLFKHAALLAAAQPRAATAATTAAAAATAATATAAAAETAPRGCAAAPTQLLSPMDSSVDPASTALECFAGDLLDRLVDKPRTHGWQMVVERSAAGLPKPGWIATQPGAFSHRPHPHETSPFARALSPPLVATLLFTLALALTLTTSPLTSLSLFPTTTPSPVALAVTPSPPPSLPPTLTRRQL